MRPALILATKPRVWWGVTILWFVLLFIVSSMSTLPPGPGIPFQDKIQHTIYYMIGAASLFLALRFRSPPLSVGAAFLAALVLCMAVGWFDEWHQTFTPGRRGNDIWDWLADTLGGILGPLVGSMVHHRLRAATASR